ncbi:MAG: MFS transporter [Candidatus Hodarchaeales archaeon]|jgi:DHA3 family macrolide efflux protein-like MFS transporter
MEKNVNQGNLKGYLSIWVGQLISLFGSGVVQFAIIWWITATTESAFILGFASFAGLIPLVIFTPISGVLADRWKRKYLILTTDSCQTILTFGLILLFSLNLIGIVPIIVMLFLRGMFQAIQLPSTIALVPQMVPKSQINRMNGLNSILNNVIYILTPIAGALLLEVSSIELILWIDLLTFFIAVATLFFVSIPRVVKTSSNLEQNSPKSSFKQEFMEGLTYLKENGFMILIVGGMFANILINPLFSLLPHFIKHIHNGGAVELAIILGFFQMGSLGGALFIMLMNFQPQFKHLVSAVFIAFIGLFIVGISPTSFFLSITIGSLITGISIGTVDIMIVSILQINIPNELQGRVFSILFMMVKSILPIAVLVTGGLSEVFGLAIIYIVSPVLGFILVIYLTIGSKAAGFDQNLVNQGNLTSNRSPQTI